MYVENTAKLNLRRLTAVLVLGLANSISCPMCKLSDQFNLSEWRTSPSTVLLFSLFLALQSTSCVLQRQHERRNEGQCQTRYMSDSVKLLKVGLKAVKFLSGVSAKAATQAFDKLDIFSFSENRTLHNRHRLQLFKKCSFALTPLKRFLLSSNRFSLLINWSYLSRQ